MSIEPSRLSEPRWRRDAKRGLRRLFELAQRGGIDVLPHHFYSQIPTIAELRGRQEWREARTMAGVRGLEVDKQLAFVGECCVPEVVERTGGLDLYTEACRLNRAPGFGPVEAVFLYCFMAKARPPRVVQVGAGVATAVMLRAASDFGFETEVVCVDPYPTDYLRRADERGDLRLVDERAQDVELETLTGLGPGELLFIDSTHTVKPDSEVNRIVLEVLPRLEAGVLVHYHDIYFPYDYAPGVLTTDLFFWAESTLLQAFLVHNERYRVLASLSTLHYWAQEALSQALPIYRPARHEHGYAADSPSGESPAGHFPSSLYLRVQPGGD